MVAILAMVQVSPAFSDTDSTTCKLILQITVDQLRGELPARFAQRLGEGGFRYLLQEGAHYSDAHYQHSNLERIVGHAVLTTGAFPQSTEWWPMSV